MRTLQTAAPLRRPRFGSRLIVPLAIVLGVAICVAALGAQDRTAPGNLRVLVASSIAEVARGVGEAFRDASGVEVVLSVDATSRLVTQLERGAPADVLVTADREWMDEAVEAGRVRDPRRVATGSLVVVVGAGGAGPQSTGTPPEDIAELSADQIVELLRSARRIALAGEEVPAGRYARQALAGLSALPAPDRIATGGSVRTALEWVARGEADVGVVYASDAATEPRVRVAHRVDPSLHAPVEYFGAVVVDSEHPDLAAEFLAAWSPAAAAPNGGPSLPSAILLSIVVALFAVAAGTLPAIAVGRFLAIRRFPGRALVSALLLAPLVIPPVVTGFLLLSVFGSGSPLGDALAVVGVRIPFTPIAAVLAAAVVGLPLYAVVVRSAFQSVDRRYEELAWTLGVPPRSAFRRVALPLALPGIAAGAVLAFARALGEFGATIVVAGNVEGETRTIPLAVYSLLETPGVGGRIWFFVGASVVLSLAGLVAYEALIDRQRRRMEDGRVG